MKIGNSTISIKPATGDGVKSVVVTANEPPPLAPLSVQVNKQTKTITIMPNAADGKVLVSPSQKITANKMLVDLLDKKVLEPPVFASTTIKRKIDMDSEVPAKKADTEGGDQASSKAADLYAKLASSIIDDEDEEMEDEIEKSIPTKIIEKKVIEVKPSTGGSQQFNTSNAPVQRQLIMGPNNQVILSPNNSSHQTTATIKTDSGIQTVPIILQNNSIQGMQGQTMMQQQQQPTQYILATNQQGQTYVVAQQPMPQPQIPQTVLLAQTPGQQGTQTKTIIILQQNQGQQGQTMQQIQVQQPQGQQQKIIMTPGGQQVVYSTQRPFTQQQIIQNYQHGSTIIQSGTTQTLTNRKIVFTNNSDGQTALGGAKIIQTVQQTPAQQTLQAIAQGQNIIMQKGQKFQIGNTQISQVIQPSQQQQQQQPQQQIQIVQKPVQVQRIESPPVSVSKESTSAILRAVEGLESKSPSPSVLQQELKSSEPVEASAKLEETVETPKESPSVATSSANNSGSSSPAPSQGGKQQVSIQIPVPQSQIGGPNSQQYSIKIIPSMDPAKVKDEEVDSSWPYVCDWRGCPKKKFANANEVYLHACAVHCPSLDGTPDLFCQWGGGNTLCDNLPRKRFSLMTHIFDRHCTQEAFKLGVQKRIVSIENGGGSSPGPKQPYPVTLIRQPNAPPQSDGNNINLMNGPTNIQNAGHAAMQAIKRHSIEFNIAKEQMVSRRISFQVYDGD